MFRAHCGFSCRVQFKCSFSRSNDLCNYKLHTAYVFPSETDNVSVNSSHHLVIVFSIISCCKMCTINVVLMIVTGVKMCYLILSQQLKNSRNEYLKLKARVDNLQRTQR